MYPQQRRRSADSQVRKQPGCGCGPQAIIAIVVALVAIMGYFGNTQVNPVTGEKQRVALNTKEEVVLGLQAAPEMAEQHGGAERGTRAAMLVQQVGERIVAKSPAKDSPYQFDFHLLKDEETINAFALPGGQIFITRALLNRLETEGQLAGVLGHEIGHVIQRHGAQQMAKSGLTQGLINSVAIGTSDGSGGSGAAVMAQAIGQMLNLKYGREDELESDRMGVEYMTLAGYDPNALKGVMRILDEATRGGSQPEMLSSHPKPANRIQHIEELIKERFPQGLPPGLTP